MSKGRIMSTERKIDKLIQESSFHEVRYLVDAPGFDGLANKNKVDYREDWYFKDYRIRHSVIHNEKMVSVWSKIYNNQSGLAEKKKIVIQQPDVKKLDRESIFKLHIISKRPIYNDTELYIEKVSVYKNNKKITEFVTTEVENAVEMDELKLLKKVNGINNITRVPEKNLRSIVLKKIKSALK